MAVKRGPYKQYLMDEEREVPRSTRRRWDKNHSFGELDQPSNLYSESDGDLIALVEEPSSDNNNNVSSEDENLGNGTSACNDEVNLSSISDEVFVSYPQNSENSNDDKIYEGSRITIIEAISLILSLFLKYSLTRECLSDILKLLHFLLPQSNRLPNTKYKLLKFIESYCYGINTITHYYCPLCQSYLGEKEQSVCNVCKNSIEKIAAQQSVFVEFPIESSLRLLLEHEKVYQFFENRLDNHTQMDSNYVQDIYDGQMYKYCSQDQGRYDLNLLWNSDGISVFKSSTVQLWPIQFIITNVPPYLRRKYLLVAGLWNGQIKPQMNTFLRPFCQSLVKLGTIGFSWIHPENGQTMISKVIAPVATVDAPARAMLQNIHQFNGEYGCSACEHPGCIIQVDSGGHSNVYLPDEYEYPERNSDRMRSQAETAVQTKQIVKGVKGPSCVNLLPHFDSGYGFVPDYMHSVLLGVVRSLTFAWLDTVNHIEVWYLGSALEIIEDRLQKIYVPSYMTRVPRSIQQKKYWKANEWRSWLLFYCLPVLNGLLPDKYLQHLMLLVMGVYILLQDKIAPHFIELADTLLKLFVEHMPELYKPSFCTYNVHQITHLASAVKRWGPLWAHSAFLFENSNGSLLRMIQGTQEIQKQMSQVLSLSFGLSIMRNKLSAEQWEGFHVLQNLFCQSSSLKRSTRHLQIGNIKLLGKGKCTFQMPQYIIRAVHLAIGNSCADLAIYSRIIHNNDLFSSECYTRSLKRNSHTVSFTVNKVTLFGSVYCYVLQSNCKVFAVIYELEIEHENGAFQNKETTVSLHFIHKVKKKCNSVKIIPINCITTLCLQVLDYIIVPPNRWEKNL